MALIDRLRDAVRAGTRGQLKVISDQSGVPLKTLRNYYYGVTKDMRYETARRLEDALNRHYGRRESDQQAAFGTHRQMR